MHRQTRGMLALGRSTCYKTPMSKLELNPHKFAYELYAKEIMLLA